MHERKFIAVSFDYLGTKAFQTLAALRMQRWATEEGYRRSADHTNADTLPHLPRASVNNTAEEGGIFYFSHRDELPVSAKDIERATLKDPILNKVWSSAMNGWPSYLQDQALRPYCILRQELTSEQGCMLWRQRVIILPVFRQQLMEDLHYAE